MIKNPTFVDAFEHIKILSGSMPTQYELWLMPSGELGLKMTLRSSERGELLCLFGGWGWSPQIIYGKTFMSSDRSAQSADGEHLSGPEVVRQALKDARLLWRLCNGREVDA